MLREVGWVGGAQISTLWVGRAEHLWDQTPWFFCQGEWGFFLRNPHHPVCVFLSKHIMWRLWDRAIVCMSHFLCRWPSLLGCWPSYGDEPLLQRVLETNCPQRPVCLASYSPGSPGLWVMIAGWLWLEDRDQGVPKPERLLSLPMEVSQHCPLGGGSSIHAPWWRQERAGLCGGSRRKPPGSSMHLNMEMPFFKIFPSRMWQAANQGSRKIFFGVYGLE